jgi:hypothetical protein
LGKDVVIGAGAKVLGGFTIGDGAKVGSNAVVTKPVPEGAVMVGIPARATMVEGGRKDSGFLAYGTLMRANILVDSFTQALPAALRHGIDAVWMLVWAGVLAVLAWQLGIGAMETRGNHTTTMVLGLPTWWAMLLGALGFAAAALAALYWTARFARGRA